VTGAPAGGFGVPDGPRTPPRLLGAAAGFVYATAASAALWALVGLIGASGLADALTADPGVHGSSTETAGRFGVQVWLTVVSLALAALMLAAATALAARSLTRGRVMGYWWSIGLVGLYLAIAVFGAATRGVQQNIVAVTAETGDYSADLGNVIDALPDWYGTYTLAHNVAVLVVGLAALVLLVLPSSGDHFAHRPPPGAGGGEFEVPR